MRTESIAGHPHGRPNSRRWRGDKRKNCMQRIEAAHLWRGFDSREREVRKVNDFLDVQATRGLSVRSLRAYGYSLLNFWRWITQVGGDLSGIQESDLLDYIRFQKHESGGEGSKVAPKTINHRLTVVRSLYRFHCGCDIPGGSGSYRARSHPYHNTACLCLRMPPKTGKQCPLPPRGGDRVESLSLWRRS